MRWRLHTKSSDSVSVVSLTSNWSTSNQVFFVSLELSPRRWNALNSTDCNEALFLFSTLKMRSYISPYRDTSMEILRADERRCSRDSSFVSVSKNPCDGFRYETTDSDSRSSHNAQISGMPAQVPLRVKCTESVRVSHWVVWVVEEVTMRSALLREAICGADFVSRSCRIGHR